MRRVTANYVGKYSLFDLIKMLMSFVAVAVFIRVGNVPMLVFASL
jgi:hypothetical protein